MACAVHYFVPEDGDDVAEPNLYTVGRAASKVRLGDVKRTFPLPGRYHFRFKKAFKGSFVWLDVLDDRDVVPRFDGSIMAKVSRLSVSPQNGHHHDRAAFLSREGAGAGSATPGPAAANGTATARASSAASAPSSSAPPAHRSASGGAAGTARSAAASRQARSMKGPDALQKTSSGDLIGLLAPTPSPSAASAVISAAAAVPARARPPGSAPAAAGLSAPAPTSNGGADSILGHSPSSGFSAVPLSANGGQHALHSMDWPQKMSSPSPTPSPPLVPVASPMAGPSSLNPTRSTSPVKRAGSTPAKPPSSNLHIPNDLSSAAKDFKL